MGHARRVVIPFSINLAHRDELDHFLKVENYMPSNCVMHTRSALERVGFWPEDVPHADWRCWQRIIMTSASGTEAIAVADCSPLSRDLEARRLPASED